jgi:hypothetical protein
LNDEDYKLSDDSYYNDSESDCAPAVSLEAQSTIAVTDDMDHSSTPTVSLEAQSTIVVTDDMDHCYSALETDISSVVTILEPSMITVFDPTTASIRTFLELTEAVGAGNEPSTASTPRSSTVLMQSTFNYTLTTSEPSLTSSTSVAVVEPCMPIPTTAVASTSAIASNLDPGISSPTVNKGNGSRKRERNTQLWKRSQKQDAYNSGLSVKRKKKDSTSTTSTRKVHGQCMTSTCKRKCASKIDANQQETINRVFWDMGRKDRRHDFISSNTSKQPVATRRKPNSGVRSKPKDSSYYFFLPNSKKERVSVCKPFFLNTLDISAAMVREANKCEVSGATSVSSVVTEKRGGHNKTKADSLSYVRTHILSFPRVESHYCRATRKCEYLEGTLSIKAMYRLYEQKCILENITAVKESLYRQIFVTEFNLRFHQPSKDSCDTCCKFDLRRKSNGGVLLVDDEHEYALHIRRKEQARSSKIVDKESASNIKVCAAMDLEQVLTVPKLSVGSAYYLRKLNMYNLTFYNLGTKDGTCYMWTEAEAGRGANEVASALYHWLCDQDTNGAQHTILYSDTCGGQNRNRIVSSMIMVFLSKSVNTLKVEQKYFESGHSQMECDAMHSSIEVKARKRDIHLPSQYEQIAREARPKFPYKVVSMTRDSIYDWGAVNATMRSNAFAGMITKHHLTYERTADREVSVAFSDEIGSPNDQLVVYKKRGRNIELTNFVVPLAYTAALGIDPKKKDDLLKLCEFLPTDCKNFYQSLLVRE